MALVQDDHVIEALTTDTPDQPLDVRILPRTPGGDSHFFDPHVLHPLPKRVLIDPVPITNQISRGLVPRKGIPQLKSRDKPGGFEVIAGKSILAFRRDDDHPEASSKCFAFVQTYDDKPKRRLFELLRSQGMQANQQIEFLSDGGETVRDLQRYLSPEAEHLLDWFHLAMRLTTMTQTAKGLPAMMGEEEALPLRDEMMRQLERLKWFLWHGTPRGASLKWMENPRAYPQ
jgi:hypothetical protein